MNGNISSMAAMVVSGGWMKFYVKTINFSTRVSTGI
jgi:hypothetical protein